MLCSVGSDWAKRRSTGRFRCFTTAIDLPPVRLRNPHICKVICLGNFCPVQGFSIYKEGPRRECATLSTCVSAQAFCCGLEASIWRTLRPLYRLAESETVEAANNTRYTDASFTTCRT